MRIAILSPIQSSQQDNGPQSYTKIDYRLHISEDGDFAKLQQAIMITCGIPIGQQRLVLKGREVDQALRVESLNMQVRIILLSRVSPFSALRFRASTHNPLTLILSLSHPPRRATTDL